MIGRLYSKLRKLSPDYPRSVSDSDLRRSARNVELAVFEQLRLTILAGARYQSTLALARHGFKAYSQHEEDGLLDEIFRRVGTTNSYFVEFGVGDGLENNTLYRLAGGWRGVWIEGNPYSAATIREVYSELIAGGQLAALEAYVSAENIEARFAAAKVPAEFDLLSIDIDGNDYWIWKAVNRYSPRVVVVEYNAGLGPSLPWIMPYKPDFAWDGSRAFGASLKALEMLGKAKGYTLVGCDISGTNAFFVRDDLVGDRFLAPHDSATHFEPPRYYLFPYPGHPPNPREAAAVVLASQTARSG